MNTQNGTVVSAEMIRKLREASLDTGYEPVPRSLAAKARRLLRGRDIASMDAAMKRKLRNRSKRMRRAGVPGY